MKKARQAAGPGRRVSKARGPLPLGCDARIRELRRRCREAPSQAGRWAELGILLLDADRPRPGVTALRKALALKPGRYDACSALALHYLIQNRDRKAIALLDGALARRRSVFDASRLLLMLLIPLSRLGDWPRLAAARERLAGLLPASAVEPRRCVEAALSRLYHLFPTQKDPAVFAFVQELILLLDPDAVEPRRILKQLQPILARRREGERLRRDEALPFWLRVLVVLVFLIGKNPPAQKRLMDEVVASLRANGPMMAKEWRSFARAYPCLAKDLAGAWREAKAAAKREAAMGGQVE